jgi:hypothetical protein
VEGAGGPDGPVVMPGGGPPTIGLYPHEM